MAFTTVDFRDRWRPEYAYSQGDIVFYWAGGIDSNLYRSISENNKGNIPNVSAQWVVVTAGKEGGVPVLPVGIVVGQVPYYNPVLDKWLASEAVAPDIGDSLVYTVTGPAWLSVIGLPAGSVTGQMPIYNAATGWGISTASAAQNGYIPIWNGTNFTWSAIPSQLPVGSAGQLLGYTTEWVAVDPLIIAGTAPGQMSFWDATAGRWTYTETTELFWDDANKGLKITGVQSLTGVSPALLTLQGNSGILTTTNKYGIQFLSGAGNTHGAILAYKDSTNASDTGAVSIFAGTAPTEMVRCSAGNNPGVGILTTPLNLNALRPAFKMKNTAGTVTWTWQAGLTTQEYDLWLSADSSEMLRFIKTPLTAVFKTDSVIFNKTSSVQTREVAKITQSFVDATDASRTGRIDINVSDYAANRNVIRATANGSGAVTQIGDVEGGNVTQIETDGTVVFVGNATVWEDLNFDPVGSGGPAATLPDYVTINDCIYREFTSANNQYFGGCKEIAHAALLTQTYYPHLHCFLKVGESEGTTGVTFTIYWELRQTTGRTSGSVPLTATSAELLANPIKFSINDETGFAGASELGGQLNLTIKRTGGDAGDVVLLTYGIHYQYDMVGSRDKLSK